MSEGLDLALRVLLNPGDEVIVPEPCYVAYEPCVAFAGGTPVRVPTRWEDDFAVDPAVVAAAVTPRTKAVLIGSPANPTGAVQPRAALDGLVRLAAEHDLYLISDEIYDRLTYTGGHTCLATLPGARERTVLLGGFSKAHAMTGWRVGWICAPAAVAELCVRVHQYTMLCAPHVSQLAAVEALSGPDHDVDAMVADYDRRRRVFVKGLREIGLDCPEPGGAFYAFPSIRASGLDSETFAERLLHAREGGRGAGQRVRAVRRGARALLLRHRAAAAGGGAGAHRPVPGLAAAASRPVTAVRSTRSQRVHKLGKTRAATLGRHGDDDLPALRPPRTAADARGLAWSSQHGPDGARVLDLPGLHPQPAGRDRDRLLSPAATRSSRPGRLAPDRASAGQHVRPERREDRQRGRRVREPLGQRGGHRAPSSAVAGSPAAVAAGTSCRQ